jgi:hypothetical protein
MSCLFLLFKNPDLKNFEKYVKVSAPLRSLPPAHALENGF